MKKLLITLWLSFVVLQPLTGVAATLVEQYWPMQNGDIKYYNGPAGQIYIRFSNTGFSNPPRFDMALYVYDPDWDDYYEEFSATVGYSTDRNQLIEYGADVGFYDYTWNPPIASLDATSLADGGSRTFQSVVKAPGTNIPVTVTITVTSAGTVVVPAGTYNQCKSVSVTAKITGTSTVVSAQAWVLAPRVGQIKVAVVNESGRVVGWESLTSGTVGGTDVKDFANQIAPTLAITSPTPGQRLSNAVATVTGTAKDNSQVTEVWYQLNGGTWTLAQTANGWSNWTAVVNLVPGTNIVRAYAVDSMENTSPIQSRTFTYVLTGVLTVQTTGKGTIAPNYNGQLLEIGKRFTMTATPALGFNFTNWTGSLTTNNRALSFIMQSNLTFTANFLDIQKPTVLITNPPVNARLNNPVVTFRGTAKDNGGLARVEYQLNGGPFTSASDTSNWFATVTLRAGTNDFRVRSVDTSANESPVAARSVFFVVPSPLTLITNGSGRIAGATNGQLLEVGRRYTLTATPASRHLFAGWSGDISSPDAVLNFLMRSNLVLQANFVTNPFVGLKGTFYGLFSETNEVRNHDRSGSFTFTLAEAGSYSASFQLGAKKLPATGKFDWLGRSFLQIKPSLTSTVTVALQLDVTNLSAKVEGVVSNQAWVSPLFGYRAPVYPITNSSPQMGKYTLIIPGSNDAAASPGGDSYGTVTVSKSGVLTLAGKLAEGTILNQSIPVSADGWWALYSSLYTGKGSLHGWMTITNLDESDITGQLSWIKPALTTSKYYPLGFTNEHEAAGSLYVPTTTNRVVNITNGVVEFRHGNLIQPITNNVLLTTNNKITNLSSNKLSMTITLTSGLFTGSVTDTNTGKSVTFNGALLQKLNAGYGFFLGTNQSGSVLFAPGP